MAYRNFIDGAWVDSSSGRTFEVRNPADDSVVGEVPDGGASEASSAIAAAGAAGPGFRTQRPSDRARLLRELSKLMGARRDELA